jgi:hypothetical protein
MYMSHHLALHFREREQRGSVESLDKGHLFILPLTSSRDDTPPNRVKVGNLLFVEAICEK